MSSANRPDQSPDESQALSSFSALVKSWFVRYYDHLISLAGINVVWFLACGALPYWLLHDNGQWNLWTEAVLLFWTLSATAVAARGVFLLLNEGGLSWDSFRAGWFESWWKASLLFLIWGGTLFLGVYNLYFYIHWNPWGRFVEWVLCGMIVWFLAFWASCFFFLWPVLFFQKPPFFKIFYKAFLLVLESPFESLAFLLLYLALFFLFCLVPVAWILLGFVFFFSFQCMLLEKRFLRYKITYQDKDYDDFLAFLDRENKRDWKYFLKPWETK
jgi:uncharacterized membrane protein YesL